MPIDFHAEENANSYTQRRASQDWTCAMRALVDVDKKRVADIGCGGGIYTVAWTELGARHVTGIDFSDVMVEAARKTTRELPDVSFRFGTAEATGLADRSTDIVFERALVHHLEDLRPAFEEAWRIMTPGGRLIIQDRSIEDVALPASTEHIRGYFFEIYPRLLDVEARRRPTRASVNTALRSAGFEDTGERQFWETRQTHQRREQLAEDLLKRTGRSILHELNDEDLGLLVDAIIQHLPADTPITERDRWTIWNARKPT